MHSFTWKRAGPGRSDDDLPPTRRGELARVSADQAGDRGTVLLQGEVPGVRQVERDVLESTLYGDPLGREDGVVLPPDDRRRRPVPAGVGVPGRVERVVGMARRRSSQGPPGEGRPAVAARHGKTSMTAVWGHHTLPARVKQATAMAFVAPTTTTLVASIALRSVHPEQSPGRHPHDPHGPAEVAAVDPQGGLAGEQGRRATTHWRVLDETRASFPAVAVVDDEHVVEDGDVLTSAGISAGIDLSLKLVAGHHGEVVARATAGTWYPYPEDNRRRV